MPIALLSVSDKTGIVDLGRGLLDLGFDLVSSGGTAEVLSDAGLSVTRVSDYTGANEVFGGRVKTLHPKVHGGILGRRGQDEDEAADNGIQWIDLVACNLYPFEKTVTGGEVDLATAIEKIDIGGPSMVRSAAKNHASVTVLTDPGDYAGVLEALSSGTLDGSFRQKLALKAFRHTACYDAIISTWLERKLGAEPADEGALPIRKMQPLRYGENPHQRAIFYASPLDGGRSLARAEVLQGKALSFNNLADLDATLRAAFEYDEPACVIVKHMNPCGVGVHEDGPSAAFKLALSGDPVSAFGGIVVFNRALTGDDVRTVRMAKTFFEVLAAPGFSDEALEKLSGRKNLRVLRLPEDWAASRPAGTDFRRVQGGFLLQDWDLGAEMTWTVATKRAPTEDEARALKFAWKVCRNLKSNAISLARAEDGGFVSNGAGAGQMSRVDSVRLAVSKATREVAGSVLASDAFFPFADGVEVATSAGVTAIIQPGGSVKDADVIAACDAAGVAMIFTGCRHFRH